jgi:hypothetical protein
MWLRGKFFYKGATMILFGVYKNYNTKNKNKWQFANAFYKIAEADIFKKQLIEGLKKIGYDDPKVVLQSFFVDGVGSADDLPEYLKEIKPEPEPKHFVS